MAPVHWAAGSDGETNFGLTSLAAPNAAASSLARYSRRESHHSDGITDQKSLQRTSATKSAITGREQMQQKLVQKGWTYLVGEVFAGSRNETLWNIGRDCRFTPP